MRDITEGVRRVATAVVNGQVESEDVAAERARLEEIYGEVWDTRELTAAFEVTSFMSPFCMVRRKKDGKKGMLMFQHSPRFYFQFTPK